MKFTKKPGDDWEASASTIWQRKLGLREYYQSQIFDRIISEMIEGETLQLGCGPGFFARYYQGMVNSDIVAYDGVDTVADVHKLPFKGASFHNVVGVDVLHHLLQPGLAINECARVLISGGRLILVEPWAGPLGHYLFKYIHHEDCIHVEDPWNNAFPGNKKPMDGNTMIPYMVFHERENELSDYAPDFLIMKKQYFGSLSFLSTGGMQEIGLPASVTRLFYRLEARFPQSVKQIISFQGLFVLEKFCTTKI